MSGSSAKHVFSVHKKESDCILPWELSQLVTSPLIEGEKSNSYILVVGHWMDGGLSSTKPRDNHGNRKT